MSTVVLSKRIDARLSLAALGGALLFLYLFGIHGFLRAAPLGGDFLIFHRAAAAFVGGGNPWLELKDTGEPFSYPPHAAALLAIYGFLSSPAALALHTLLNVLAIGIFCYLANLWFLKIDDFRTMTLAQGLGLAIIIGNPFMAHSVFEGQITLPTAAAALLSWHFLHSGRVILAGIFLGLATVKPHVSLFYIVWLLLSSQWRVLAIGAATAGAMLAPSVAAYGLFEAFDHWLASLRGYATVAVNMPGSPHVVGLESFAVAIGVNGLGWSLKFLGLVATGILFHYRDRLEKSLTVNLFFATALTFIFGHDTGYAAILLVCAHMVFLALERGDKTRLAIAGILLMAFFFPQRFLREIDVPALHHTRTFILPLCCYAVYRWTQHRRLHGGA